MLPWCRHVPAGGHTCGAAEASASRQTRNARRLQLKHRDTRKAPHAFSIEWKSHRCRLGQYVVEGTDL